MSSSLKAQKVQSANTDGFTKTLKYEILHQAAVDANHNKFYCLELQQNPQTDEFRVFSHYGRLGKTNVFDVRGPVKDEYAADKEYDSILAKKKKGKKIKDKDTGEIKVEAYFKVDIVMPTVGSDNIRKGTGAKTLTTKVAHIDSSSFGNPEVSRIIDQVTQENIHNITAKTTFTLTSNGFETPLGPVTKEHVIKAKEPLNVLKGLLKKGKLDDESRDVREANNHYYSLIPHPFGHKITMDDWILSDVKLIEEFDLLDQLETAVQMGSALNQGAKQKLNALGSDIDLLDDKKEFERIYTYTEKSRAHNHQNIWDWKVKNIFKLHIPSVHQRFEKDGKKLGNIKELFHGSQNCNILSILKNGLIIPPVNAGHVTGRMFSDGIYAAHNSTKALNYAIGYWSGRRNKANNAFLFLTKFAMGKVYEPSSSFSGRIPAGYHSTHAKRAKTGLHNDEYIVYSLGQATLTYLLELRR